MRILFIILGIICGIFIALILNKLFAVKIEDKSKRTGLKITSFIVCIILGVGFVLMSSLRSTLDKFLENKIILIETSLSEAFPDKNILEMQINTSELALISNEINTITDKLETISDGYFEKIIFNAFLGRYTNYVYAVQNGMDTLISMSDDNGLVTIKSILHNLKNIFLETISPYFIVGHVFILLLLFIYIGIVIFLSKGDSMYNKSIVYGNVDYDGNSEKIHNKE